MVLSSSRQCRGPVHALRSLALLAPVNTDFRGLAVRRIATSTASPRPKHNRHRTGLLAKSSNPRPLEASRPASRGSACRSPCASPSSVRVTALSSQGSSPRARSRRVPHHHSAILYLRTSRRRSNRRNRRTADAPPMVSVRSQRSPRSNQRKPLYQKDSIKYTSVVRLLLCCFSQ